MGSDLKGILHVRERLDFFMETAEASLDSACLENGAYFILFHFKVISVEPRLLIVPYIYIYKHLFTLNIKLQEFESKTLYFSFHPFIQPKYDVLDNSSI